MRRWSARDDAKRVERESEEWKTRDARREGLNPHPPSKRVRTEVETPPAGGKSLFASSHRPRKNRELKMGPGNSEPGEREVVSTGNPYAI